MIIDFVWNLAITSKRLITTVKRSKILMASSVSRIVWELKLTSRDWEPLSYLTEEIEREIRNLGKKTSKGV